MTASVSPSRLGIFGGTFDPIHLGHLLIAEYAREHLRLEQVRFIPAAIAPHKQHLEPTEAKHRTEMVRLAINSNRLFEVDDCEIRRGGTSYTVDTLRELHQQMPDAELFLLIGSDSLAELHTWREPDAICGLAFMAILSRGGFPAPDLSLLGRYLPPDTTPEELAAHLVPLPQLEISSTDIRQRVASGKSVRYQLPPAVEAYVAAHELYRR